jgi:hypothetical protein
MAALTIVYWRDIPAQVIAKRGRETAKRQLSDRFQQAIDAAAMRAKLAGADAYLNEWRRAEPASCGEDLEQEAASFAAKLERDYDDARLARLVAAGGRDAGA